MKKLRSIFTVGTIGVLGFGLVMTAQERPGETAEELDAQPEEQEEQPELDQQEQEREQEDEFGVRLPGQEEHHKATELKGKEVNSQDGERLGQVEDVAVDLETGELSYVLITDEENGSEWTAVPPQAIQVQQENGETQLTVNIDQQQWDEAPTVTEEEIAELGEEQKAREVYEHFGEDYEARQQEIQEFAAPEREREEQTEENGLDRERDEQLGREQPGPPGQQQGVREREQQQQQPGQQQEQPGTQPGQEQGQPGQQQEQPGQQQEDQAGMEEQTEANEEGEEEFAGPERTSEPKLASKLMEARIDAPDQEEAAKINDLLLNLEEGYVDMVLIESEFVDGTFAVAPQAFEEIEEDQWQLNVSQEDLEQAQELQEGQIRQHAEQARMVGPEQTREQPEVFRYEEEEEEDPIFGAPEDRDHDEEDDHEEDDQEEMDDLERDY